MESRSRALALCSSGREGGDMQVPDKDLKVDVDTTSSVGKILLFSTLVVWLAHFVHPLGHPQSVGEIAS